MSKIMQVYYDNAGLPYKDSGLTIQYPILSGDIFVGGNNTTEIHFYTDELISSATWVANIKLPTESTPTYRLLSSAVDNDGYTYQVLVLDNEITSVKGHVKIGLNGYSGTVSIDTSDEDEITIDGTPDITATGIVDITMNYSPIVIPTYTFEPTILQQILAAIGTRNEVSTSIYVIDTIENVTPSDISLANTQIVFAKDTEHFYLVNSNDEFEEITTIDYTDLAQTISALKTFSAGIDLVSGDSTFNLGQASVDDELIYAPSTSTILVESGSGTTLIDIDSGTLGLHNIADPTNSGDVVSKNYADTLDATCVHLTNAETISGNKTFSGTGNQITGRLIISSADFNLYNSYVTTNSKNYFARVGITTGSYVNYKLPYNYSDVGATTYTLATQEDVNAELATKQDTLTFDDTPTENSTNPVTSGGVYNAVESAKDYADTLFTSTLVYSGTLTVAQVSALNTSSIKTGAFYNVSDSGTITWTYNGTSYSLEVLAGDNIAWTGSSWDKLTMDLSAYDDKFISAGFFEVQSYDEDTGNIVFVYASDLYNMSYDANSGVMTIQAN